MKVFVAGATGAVGRQLLPQLRANGHEVTAMARDAARCDLIRSLGAAPVVADALDAEAVARAVGKTAPEAIVHQLTALPRALDVRHFDREFALTNRLRTEGTDHLLTAGRAAGVRRFVAHSFAGWPYGRTGGAVKSEEDALDPDPPEAMRMTLEAIRHLEDAVLGADWTEGIVLRCGNFYGPGTEFSTSPPGAQAELIRRRRLPIVGAGVGSVVVRTRGRRHDRHRGRGRQSGCRRRRRPSRRSARFGSRGGQAGSRRARWRRS